ncbi:hypothetical protein SAMN05660703_0731 [Cellulophaga tyrosinoxydans]|uniref:Uncharacterized protein n=1 Tax=Cellulophaga tyrosinoxydans TaxID=504486 RepID=A0A1W1YPZ5_9FLAO|nr:hypothetical protein SAMN05660703_0731 [Cellulophaga tyrosinoxydans]
MNIISKFEHNSLKVRRLCGAGKINQINEDNFIDFFTNELDNKEIFDEIFK